MTIKSFKNLKVCVVGPMAPPAGGMANQTAELRQRLSDEAAQITFVPVNAPYRPVWAGRIKGLRALFRLIPYLCNLWTAIGKADIVHLLANSGWSWHLFAAPAIWIASWRKTPLVLNYRGGHAGVFFDKSWSVIQPTIKRAGAITVPSEYLQGVFQQYGLTAEVIPNTLDQQLFHPEETNPTNAPASSNKHAPTNKSVQIVLTRNLEQIYGIDLAIEALPGVLKHYPQLQMTIAGEGPERKKLEELAEKLNVAEHIVFTGRLAREEVATLYRSADLLLNPSRVDNSPNSLIEALACGLPIVSTAAGGIPKLVKHMETAYLVERPDSKLLSDGIVSLLNDEGLRNRLVQNGLQYSQRFYWDNVRELLLKNYLQVMETAS